MQYVSNLNAIRVELQAKLGDKNERGHTRKRAIAHWLACRDAAAYVDNHKDLAFLLLDGVTGIKDLTDEELVGQVIPDPEFLEQPVEALLLELEAWFQTWGAE